MPFSSFDRFRTSQGGCKGCQADKAESLEEGPLSIFIKKLDPQQMAWRSGIFSKYTRYAEESGAINLSQGLPEPMMDNLFRGILNEVSGEGWQYAPPNGQVRLREAISRKLYNGRISVDNILVTSGCTESLCVALRALQNSFASNVAFFEPFYPYYPGFSQLAGLHALPVTMVPSDFGFEPDWENLECRFRSGLDILLLNIPHNPTGWVLSEDHATRIRELADRYGTYLLIDEAYKSFVYDGLTQTAVNVLIRDNKRYLVAGSFSKLFSATGLRVGWLAGNAEELKLARTIHEHVTYCQPPILQALAARVLETRSEIEIEKTMHHYSAKRTLLLQGLSATGLRCFRPSGGHFVLAEYSAFSALGSELFCKMFAEVYGVMPLPSVPFFNSSVDVQQVRFSFAAEMRAIENAVDRFFKRGLVL